MKPSFWLLATILASPAAQAATLQYRFTGTVTEVSSSLRPEFSVGESVAIEMSVDDEGLGPPLDVVEYYHAFDLTLAIGDYAVAGTVGGVTILDGFGDVLDSFGTDFHQAELSGPSVNGAAPEYFSIRLGFPSTTFGSTALPHSLPLELSSWSPAGLRFGDDSKSVKFRIDSVAVVPEPTTALLVLSGTLGLAWVGRRPR